MPKILILENITQWATLVDEITCSLRCLNDDGQELMTDNILNGFVDKIYNKFNKAVESYGFIDGDATNLEILFQENVKNDMQKREFAYSGSFFAIFLR